MHAPVVTIGPESSLAEALDILERAPFSGLPVIDRTSRVVGILSKTDIISGVLKGTDRSPGEMVAGMVYHFLRGKVDPERLGEVLVQQVMTRTVHTVKMDTPVEKVAQLMMRYEINRVPVVDDDRRLVGIITRSDLLAVLSKL